MDEGLLGGLAEGIQSGMSSYKDARRMKMDAEAQAKQAALQQRQLSLSESEKKQVYDPISGKYSESPEAQIERRNKIIEGGLKEGYMPTFGDKNEITGRTLLEQKQKVLSPLEQAQLRKTNAEIAKLNSDPAEKKGKILPGGEISAVAEANSIVKQLGDFGKKLDSSSVAGGGLLKSAKRGIGGLFGSVSGTNKTANEVNTLDAEQNQLVQVVGKYLEGGKLTDPDFERYKKNLPSVEDSPSVRSAKIANLQKLVSERQASLARGYGEAGYDVSGISLADGSKQINPQQKAPTVAGYEAPSQDERLEAQRILNERRSKNKTASR